MVSKIDRWSLIFRAGLIFQELALEKNKDKLATAELLLSSVECMNEYSQQLPDWQIEIREKNLLRAGTLYRELAMEAIRNGNKSVTAQYQLLASKSFSLLTKNLDNWQEDARDKNPVRAGIIYRELAIEAIKNSNKDRAAIFHLLASETFEKAKVKLTDWQEDARDKNPMRAGALYRELAIDALKNKDELQAAKYHLFASICFSKLKNIPLDEWQVDIRDKNPMRAAAIYHKLSLQAQEKLDFAKEIELKIATALANVGFVSLIEKNNNYYLDFFNSYHNGYLKKSSLDLAKIENLQEEILNCYIDDIHGFTNAILDGILIYLAYGYKAEALKKINQIYLDLYNQLHPRFDSLEKNHHICESELDPILERIGKFSKILLSGESIGLNPDTIRLYKTASVNVLSKGYKKLAAYLLLVTYYISNNIEYINCLSVKSSQLINQNVKNEKTLDIIIRPHQFGAKSTFFDTQYLLASLESVLNNSPNNSRIFLIVNDVCKIPKIVDERLIVVSFDEIANQQYFDFISKYVHLSTNHIEFEMFAIASYFLIQSVCDLYSIDSFLVVEGDTLIFRPFEKFIENFHSSYYLSNFDAACFGRLGKDLIDHYCNVVIESYSQDFMLKNMQELYNKMTSQGLSGGINDMTFWNWIYNNVYNYKAGFNWVRCDEVKNLTICDLRFHRNDRKYNAEREINVDLLLHDYEVFINGETKILPGKKVFVIENEHGDSEIYYANDKLDKSQHIRVNTAHFGGIYKYVMVELWDSLIAKNKFKTYYPRESELNCNYKFIFDT